MGIRFIDSLLMLLTACTGVFAAYLVGHGISNHYAWPWIAAGGCAVLALGLGWFLTRRLRRYAEARDGGHH